MQKFFYLLFIFLLAQNLMASEYKLDEGHSTVGFKIKHLMISTVSGRFNKFSGTFDFDKKSGKIDKIKVKIDANSIDTNEPDRDKHLRSADFFEVDKFPTLEFVSTKVDYKGNKPHTVHGNLTIHGITKAVKLDVDWGGNVVDPWGNERVAFEAKTKIDRKDFGLKWNKNLDKGGVMISDEVKIEIGGEAILQK